MSNWYGGEVEHHVQAPVWGLTETDAFKLLDEIEDLAHHYTDRWGGESKAQYTERKAAEKAERERVKDAKKNKTPKPLTGGWL